MKKNQHKLDDTTSGKAPVPGYPEYSSDEDIYSNEEKEPLNEDLLPDNVADKKGSSADGVPSIDGDLDVPGAELDDADELIGEEDEENNYYSLGGDDHDDLDEDKDE